MAIDDNTRDDSFSDHEDGDKEYFAEHNKNMKLFRESHHDWTTSRMTLFDTMVPYDAECNPAETEKPVSSMDETYWLTLVPLQGVTERRLVFN